MSAIGGSTWRLVLHIDGSSASVFGKPGLDEVAGTYPREDIGMVAMDQDRLLSRQFFLRTLRGLG